MTDMVYNWSGVLACVVLSNALIVKDAGATSSEGSMIAFKSQKIRVTMWYKGNLAVPGLLCIKKVIRVDILLLLH